MLGNRALAWPLLDCRGESAVAVSSPPLSIRQTRPRARPFPPAHPTSSRTPLPAPPPSRQHRQTQTPSSSSSSSSPRPSPPSQSSRRRRHGPGAPRPPPRPQGVRLPQLPHAPVDRREPHVQGAWALAAIVVGASWLTSPTLLNLVSQKFNGQHGQGELPEPEPIFLPLLARRPAPAPARAPPVALTPRSGNVDLLPSLLPSRPAFLFHTCLNVTCGLPEDRSMTTGLHTVRDLRCVRCNAYLGWKYVSQARLFSPWNLQVLTGPLFCLRCSGQGLRALAEVQGRSISWSPRGALLLPLACSLARLATDTCRIAARCPPRRRITTSSSASSSPTSRPRARRARRSTRSAPRAARAPTPTARSRPGRRRRRRRTTATRATARSRRPA